MIRLRQLLMALPMFLASCVSENDILHTCDCGPKPSVPERELAGRSMHIWIKAKELLFSGQPQFRIVASLVVDAKPEITWDMPHSYAWALHVVPELTSELLLNGQPLWFNRNSSWGINRNPSYLVEGEGLLPEVLNFEFHSSHSNLHAKISIPQPAFYGRKGITLANAGGQFQVEWDTDGRALLKNDKELGAAVWYATSGGPVASSTLPLPKEEGQKISLPLSNLKTVRLDVSTEKISTSGLFNVRVERGIREIVYP